MTEIVVEVRPHPGRAGELAGPNLLERFETRVSELGESPARIAMSLKGDLEARIDDDASGPWSLDEVELEFSLDLEAEAGIVVARGATRAGFHAKLTWRRNLA